MTLLDSKHRQRRVYIFSVLLVNHGCLTVLATRLARDALKKRKTEKCCCAHLYVCGFPQWGLLERESAEK